MILLKSLIILLLILIVAHLIKVGWGKKEGFQELYKEDMQMATSEANDTSDTSDTSDANNAKSASQKAQEQAYMEDEEDTTVSSHKNVSKEAFDMSKLKGQVEELLKLSEDAKKIDEDIKSRN
jgi:FtsZ-interacting cell division protein ZipA